MNMNALKTTFACVMIAVLGTANVVQAADGARCGLLNQEKREVSMKVTQYSVRNPMASACALAGLGSLATVLKQEMDRDLQEIINVAAVPCGLYCLFGDNEGCRDAASVWIAAGMRWQQIEAERQNVSCPN